MPRTASSRSEGVSIQDRWTLTTGKVKPANHPDRKRKRYRLRITVPGTKVQEEAGAYDDREEAKAKGLERLAALRAGTDVHGDADLQAVAAEYVKGLREQVEGQPSGSESYARHVELVAAGLVAAGIRDLKSAAFPAHVHGWIARLKPGWWAKLVEGTPPSASRTTPITNSTRNRCVREVRALCSYAESTRRVLYNPGRGIKSFSAEKRLRPQFTMAELRTIISDASRLAWSAERRELDAIIVRHNGDKRAAAAELEVNVATVYNRAKTDPQEADPWWLPCCLLLYGGFRVGEGLHLRWQDIDWKGRRIRVRLQEDYDQKTNAEREVPLQAELAAILKPMGKTAGFIIESEAMRASGSAHRDGERKIVRRDYAHGFKRYLGRIGIPVDAGNGDRTPHSLRHAWVALMIASGESPSLAAMWAGHSGDVQKLYQSQADAYHRDGASAWERGQFELRSVSAPAAAEADAS